MLRTVTATLALLLPLACADATPVLELVDPEGNPVRPLEGEDVEAAVLIFTRTDCPISNRYAPEVRRLHESYGPRGIGFWLVYLDREESADAIRAHLAEYGYAMGALRDVDHAVAIRTGAEVTPEAAVFDARGRLVYRGRIDDRYRDFGRARPEATRRDVAEALDAVLAGRSVDVARAPAVGCTIADLR